jgi:hypothetical protein
LRTGDKKSIAFDPEKCRYGLLAMPGKMSACLRLVLVVTVLSELGAFQVEADYDNHWAFYYESPCCGHHHLRHHKGENIF